MALGSRSRPSPCRNPPASTADPAGKPDELAPAEGAPALDKYTDEDLQRITKLCMDSLLQGQGQSQANQKPQERPFKARFPDLYFGKSHMDCYHFCQQCGDHFNTAQATGTNRTSFAASFL